MCRQYCEELPFFFAESAASPSLFPLPFSLDQHYFSYSRNPSLRSPKARRTWGYNCGRPILALNKDILGPEAGCSPGKIILVQMTLNKILLSFDNVHRPSWTVAVLSQNQDFGHAAFWLILAKKVRVPVVAKAHFVESAPPGARQPWWREHRADRDRNRFPPGISPL